MKQIQDMNNEDFVLHVTSRVRHSTAPQLYVRREHLERLVKLAGRSVMKEKYRRQQRTKP